MMPRSRFASAVVLGALAASWAVLACGDESFPEALSGNEGRDAGPAPLRDGAGPDAAESPDAEVVVDGGADGGGVPADPPLCAKGATWGAATSLGIIGTVGPLVPAVTPDELTVAWTTDTGGVVTVRYADRAALGDAFVVPVVLVGSYAFDRVAISPDGLRLVLVASNRRSFVERLRSSRTDVFAADATGQMQNIDDEASMMPAGELLGDPVFGPSDRSFYYSRFGGGRTRTIHASFRLFGSDTWPVGQALSANAGLDAVGGQRRRPSAVSADGQTLFFFDETTSTQKAGWTALAPDDFGSFEDLGSRVHAMPNAACTRLVFATQVDGGAGAGVSVAPRL